ncbi:uncharacterized protein [Coffea arabica]|uniref:Uncharacterized protein isoform X2 n=1 Tax=Coffea arabica TaxID=13443 RepID=A0A6P6VAE0_COFAR|nr:uncharacterized protein LOC113719075 isoform X2 [Coffea arabica]
MEGEEAKLLLGFPPHSHPSPSQVKTAYKSKVWDTHPDRFPPHLKSKAEHRFKLVCSFFPRLAIPSYELSPVAASSYTVSLISPPLQMQISEAYACLRSASYSKVVRSGVPRACGSGGHRALIAAPFLLIVLSTVAFGGSIVTRSYKRQKEAYPSHNPFLP